jgi:hypothetical protein
MSAVARRSRVPPVQLDAVEKPRAGIGHNGGPPLDNSGSMFLWRRAVKRAWKTPPREIALRRLAEAERLGLSYRDYTAVLKDRGQHLRGAIIVADTLAALLAEPVQARLAALDTIAVCVAVRLPLLHGTTWRPDDAHLAEKLAFAPERLLACWIRRARDPRFAAVPTLAQTIARFMRRFDLPPGAIFMVGCAALDHAAAQRAGLALYKSADAYFRRPQA